MEGKENNYDVNQGLYVPFIPKTRYKYLCIYAKNNVNKLRKLVDQGGFIVHKDLIVPYYD